MRQQTYYRVAKLLQSICHTEANLWGTGANKGQRTDEGDVE